MPDPNANPAPNDSSAIPEWKNAFGAEAAPVLETFKEPGDFLKSYTALTGELKTLKDTPFDWRKEIFGDDEKGLALGQRFSTGKDFGKAHLEAVAKIRSGELAKPLPKDAKPEEVTEWRKANGIPEKPEGYFEKLPNGRVIGKEDQPLFDAVAAKLHGRNVPPEVIHDLVEWYYGHADKENATLSETDKRQAQESEAALREAWGNDFSANENHLSNYLAGLPEGLQKAFNEGFGGDGRRLLHNPEFKQWLSNISREFNPLGIVSPGGNESAMASIDKELEGLIKLSGDSHSAYWKGPNAEKMQARHIALNAKKEALALRMGK